MFTVNFGSRTPVYQQLYDDVVLLTDVYKRQIPQISENLTQTGNIEVPDTCPACGLSLIHI